MHLIPELSVRTSSSGSREGRILLHVAYQPKEATDGDKDRKGFQVKRSTGTAEFDVRRGSLAESTIDVEYTTLDGNPLKKPGSKGTDRITYSCKWKLTLKE